jgi:hypothetical protein
MGRAVDELPDEIPARKMESMKRDVARRIGGKEEEQQDARCHRPTR